LIFNVYMYYNWIIITHYLVYFNTTSLLLEGEMIKILDLAALIVG